MTTPRLILYSALVLVFVLAILARHIVGPFLLRARHFTPVDPGFEEISDAKAQILFPPMFFETVQELSLIGFSLVCHLIRIRSGRTRTALSIFVNRETNTMALVGRVGLVGPTSTLPVGFIEFDTRFEDGAEVDTINAPTVNVFYDAPEKTVNRVSHLKDAASLYRVHQYVVARRASAAVLPEPGMEAKHFRESHRRTLDRQADLGYHFLDQDGKNYRLTWKSAFRSSWRLLWPAKQIILRRQERKGRRLADEASQAQATGVHRL